jgi:hypothetical protein
MIAEFQTNRNTIIVQSLFVFWGLSTCKSDLLTVTFKLVISCPKKTFMLVARVVLKEEEELLPSQASMEVPVPAGCRYR